MTSLLDELEEALYGSDALLGESYLDALVLIVERREQEARIDENKRWAGIAGNDVPHILLVDILNRLAELKGKG